MSASAAAAACLQGAGKQGIGMCINLAACYCVATPAALLGGFYLRGSVEGMFIGILCAPMTSAAIMSVFAWLLDWERLAREAAAAAAAEEEMEAADLAEF